VRLQVIESPCRREPTVAGQQREKQIRQIDTESDRIARSAFTNYVRYFRHDSA